MNKAIYRIASLIMAFAMILGNTIYTQAAGNVYYVSPTGSDTNPGTSTAPFKTFAKANSMLTAGSTLNIYAGVYNQQLKITKSGTSSAGITVQPLGGTVVVDMLNAASAGLDVRASYVTVSGLEIRNSGDICVNLTGNTITVNGLVVHDCSNHGIQANNSSKIKILNSRVYRTVLSNAARTLSGGWGSAIKVRVSDTILIQGNIIYNNYGEGMGTRGTDVTIRGNTVYDNYSVNIYTNSENALIERNFVYCTPHSGYERSGLPAAGITLGEEYFDGWGARLKNARVLNNIIAFCKHGVRYNGADDELTDGGLKNATIAYNTMYGSTNAALSIVYESAQAGSLIANNIIWQAQNKLSAVDNPVGLTFQNNLWKVLPPTALRSPGDKVGEPNFASNPGYTPESYRPASSSAAAGAAADIGIANDFFAKQRGPSFDIGAIQFANGTVSSSSQSTATPTSPAVQPTNTVVSPTFFTPTETPASTPTQPASQTTQETTYDNKHAAFVYSAGWVEEVKTAAMGGSYAQTSKNGSSVTFQFTGQSFSVIYKGGPSYRTMDVYIDGVLVGTIDQRHDASTYKARWDYLGQLSSGQHTLKLVFVTIKSSTLGSVDAVIVRDGSAQSAPTATLQPSQPESQTSQETVYDNKDSAFVYSAGWVEEVKTAAMGGSYARTSQNGSSVSFQFTGQSFSIVYKGGPSYRNMDVYIDGVLVGTINQQHDASIYKARWDYPGQLSSGQRTLKLIFVTAKSSTSGLYDK
ncbi:MAG TPA: right-handed parallel beta-helix repeat-containing protein [Anaerolineales bacterium]|nr:right-handed parallel beta-helix repeat-containing protein [Anaerolineales bacterium]